jgi:hypothetical protein
VGLLLGAAFSVPLFFAGIVFTESFRRAHGSANVFGANILGAVAGGLAQNLSFVLGMKALLLVAAALYAIAGVFSLFASSLMFLSSAMHSRQSPVVEQSPYDATSSPST